MSGDRIEMAGSAAAEADRSTPSAMLATLAAAGLEPAAPSKAPLRLKKSPDGDQASTSEDKDLFNVLKHILRAPKTGQVFASIGLRIFERGLAGYEQDLDRLVNAAHTLSAQNPQTLEASELQAAARNGQDYSKLSVDLRNTIDRLRQIEVPRSQKPDEERARAMFMRLPAAERAEILRKGQELHTAREADARRAVQAWETATLKFTEVDFAELKDLIKSSEEKHDGEKDDEQKVN